MGDMPEEARKELQEAIRILRDDGFHVHRTAEAYAKSKEPPKQEPPKEGDPPPVKEPPAEEPPQKRDFWFGTRGA